MTPADFAGLVRPFTLLAPVVGAGCAAGVAAAALGRPWTTPQLALALVSAAAATGASNAWNQVFDAEIDRVNKPERPVAAGRVSPGRALLLGFLLASLALGTAAFVSVGFLVCLAIGVGATWIYSAPPLRTKRRTVGALLTIAIPRGLLVPVAGWAIVAPPDRADPWALGLVAGLFVLGAAATKDFADAPGDAAHGCRTLPVLFGARRAARIVAPFLVVPFTLYPVLGLLGWLGVPLGPLFVLSFLLVSLGLYTARALLRDPEGMAAAGERGHPAWRGMYLLLLGSQVGTLAVYAFSALAA